MPAGRPRANPNKIQVTRRIRTDYWERLQEFAANCSPVVTDTAVLEAAIKEYLDRHAPIEPKTKKEKQQ